MARTADIRIVEISGGQPYVLPFVFRPEARIVLNGWQTWTLTRAQGVRGRMRGLRGVPRAVVNAWTLDGGGDYRWYRYDWRAGHLHGWTFGYVTDSEGCLLVASLSEDLGFTLIECDTKAGTITVRGETAPSGADGGAHSSTQHANGAQDTNDVHDVNDANGTSTFSGASAAITNRVAFIAAATVDEAFEAWRLMAGIEPLPAKSLVGYSSWYRHYENISEQVLKEDLVGMKRVLGGAEIARDGEAMRDAEAARESQGSEAMRDDKSASLPSSFIRVFQIDDGWARVGDWLTPHVNRFPSGMPALAAAIEREGFVPGLWVSPFVAAHDSEIVALHSSWLLRDGMGNPVRTGCHWGGAFALDTRNPEVREYIARVLYTLTAEWGFRLLKFDFLYAACMVPHDGMTRGALMADAWQLVRESVEPGTLLLACGVPLGSVFGKTHYCRVSCDVSPSWDDKFYMRPLHAERISTKNAIITAAARRSLHGRAFVADPDVFFLRKHCGLSERQRATLLESCSENGGVLLTSDDMAQWSDADVTLYRVALSRLS